MHSQNNVDATTRTGRSQNGDPIEAFKQSILRRLPSGPKQQSEVFFSPQIRQAELYGPTARPVDAGDYAQVQTIGAERGLREQEPHIFLRFRIEFNAVNLRNLVYRPNRPEQLHRLIVSADTNSRISFGRIPGTALNDDDEGFFWGEMNVSSGPIVVDFGRIGVLLTPANALFADSTTVNHLPIALELSTAQLAG